MKSGFYCGQESLGNSWSDGLLILLYHAIEAPPLCFPWRGLYVTPQKLRSQLDEFKKAGVPFVSLSEWGARPVSSRAVAITFDDAYQNLFLHALPVLQSLGVPAITFAVAGLIGDSNRWDHAAGGQKLPLMNRAEILAWVEAGQEIGSHGLTHRDLTQITLDEARREIFDSKKRLEDVTGSAVRHFCYPYGAQNEMLRNLVREAGYETACGTGMGFNTRLADRYNLDRILARHRYPILAALRGTLHL